MYRLKLSLDFLKKHKYYAYTLLILVIIVIHGRFDSLFKIDTLTLFLLVLLFILPYLPLIKTWKFKYGEFEAEVTTEEINEIKRKVNDIPQKAEKTENEDIINLKDFAESDPQLALAKMRIELEKQLRLLFNIYMPESIQHKRNRSLSFIVDSLTKDGIIEKPLASALKDIIGVANRTIHGEEISTENVLKLIDPYNTALGELEFAVIEHALKTVKKETIDQSIVGDYAEAEYLLTTITPSVSNSQKSTYKMNQAEIDAFLEGYNEYAEFIIELSKIEQNNKQV
ncbi:hypothetical protein [Dictyobacter formicarum]|uniref:DUF4145 domain-containing protein n=1 Tax=Dictyobacter formicarum TaxID=2778368 RepID=A0ABQ3VHE4_9CHLR|nr:hypothetical protein [Dictyobacter formicarum]GHO85228.1 hypothetical protein KSZ_32340 [Dictyobacter formicarum]